MSMRISIGAVAIAAMLPAVSNDAEAPHRTTSEPSVLWQFDAGG